MNRRASWHLKSRAWLCRAFSRSIVDDRQYGRSFARRASGGYGRGPPLCSPVQLEDAGRKSHQQSRKFEGIEAHL